MRSKALLVTNIFSTAYSGLLIWIIGSIAASSGGQDIFESITLFFKSYDALSVLTSGADSVFLKLFSILPVLFLVHMLLFIAGCLLGWIAYIAKVSGLAKFAATLFLFGMIAFLFTFPITLTIMILGYVGGGNQKELNKARKAQKQVQTQTQ